MKTQRIIAVTIVATIISLTAGNGPAKYTADWVKLMASPGDTVRLEISSLQVDPSRKPDKTGMVWVKAYTEYRGDTYSSIWLKLPADDLRKAIKRYGTESRFSGGRRKTTTLRGCKVCTTTGNNGRKMTYVQIGEPEEVEVRSGDATPVKSAEAPAVRSAEAPAVKSGVPPSGTAAWVMANAKVGDIVTLQIVKLEPMGRMTPDRDGIVAVRAHTAVPGAGYSSIWIKMPHSLLLPALKKYGLEAVTEAGRYKTQPLSGEVRTMIGLQTGNKLTFVQVEEID